MAEPNSSTTSSDGDHSASYDNLTSVAGRIAQNSIFERFARAGFVTSGIVHLIIGYIAIRVALGGAAGATDQSGAMAELASKPGGKIALWVGVVAFLVMALWRLAESALGKSSEPGSERTSSEVINRIKAFSLSVVYFAFAFTAFGFARGSGKSSGAQSSGLSARLMQSTAGTVALIVVGLIVIAVGGYHVYKGASRNFVKDLKGEPSDLVRRLGIVGYIAKGLAIAAIGLLFILAAAQSAPNKATGLDGAFKALLAQPYGATLLVLAGLGIITYGLYCFAMARYVKM
ncbi:DUF1206 domain-containing protein [Rhodococcus sp. OK302]|uniref:DUF1206 domain-containing protein n=1 Tax=Rhodococcus sp. OK302 TaxID=1882769 RepID=UPI000B945F05|nr:DUF1206 domain-containing protein [Rhodococcus sp. OK302]OYD70183.1 uncharacterized protein DUF1206 [Rhodococcus sp. OK302]